MDHAAPARLSAAVQPGPRPDPALPAASAPSARPLLVTGEEEVLDALLRLTAAAGVTPDVAHDEVAARACWSSASLVLVAADVAVALAAAALPRRPGLLVTTPARGDVDVWERALALGAEQVLVLPEQEHEVIGRLADSVEGATAVPFTAAVVGGCGGAGASVLATALALAAADLGSRALLLDGDPLGGGLDLALGTESLPGVRWPDLVATSGRVSAVSLREALPRTGDLTVLSWDRGEPTAVPPRVMREVLAAGRRGHDVVVADLPRRLDAVADEVLRQADVTLLVVPAEIRAVAAAGRVAGQLAGATGRVELVVRGPGPGGLDGPLVSESLGLPLAAQMRPERGLAAALDAGDGVGRRRRGPLSRTCRELVAGALARRGAVA